MIIKSLKLKDFRNYESLDIELDSNTNILYGDNAQGKTNILESIYVAGTSKSHRGSKDQEMIRFLREEAHIEMNLIKNGLPYCIDMHLKKNKNKGVAINKIPITKLGELFGILNLVVFSPEDLSIIKSSPGKRRNFIDMELCQLDRVYLDYLSSYKKVVNHRNKLLKDLDYAVNPENRRNLMDTLDVWDMQLINYGIGIIRFRKDFVFSLNEMIHKIHGEITGHKENIRVIYEPDVDEDYFEEHLAKHRDRDLRMKTTTVGPHRDDIKFLTNGIDIRYYGSQGQQRTAAVSLKLSEIQLVREKIHDTPVLLLDDVLSELDKSRQECLLDTIHDVQTVITCTGLDELIDHRFEINKIFHVVDGKVF